MSTTKRIAKNFSWLFIGNSLNGTLFFLLTIYLARVLGAAAFGLFQFAQAFVVYLVMLVDNGLSLLGTREIACDRERAGAIVLNILCIRAITSLAVFIIASAVLFFLPLTSELRLLFGASFLFIFYRALNTEWVFAGVELMEYIPLAKLLYTSGALLLIYWLVKGAPDLLKVPVVLAVSGLISSVVFILFLFGRLLPPRLADFAPATWGAIFWRALPLGASVFLMQIYYSLDTVMLGFMDRPEVVGYYNAAYRVVLVCIGLYAIWQQTAMPVMSHRLTANPAGAGVFIRKFARLTGLAFIPFCSLIYLTAPLIVDLLFGRQYAPAVTALRILIWTLLPLTISSCYSVLILIPAGRYYLFLTAVSAGALVNVLANLILIPLFSMTGAAAATVLADLASLLTGWYLARQVIKINLLREYFLPGLLTLCALPVYPLAERLLAKLPAPVGSAGAGLSFLLVYLLLLILVERGFLLGFLRELSIKK
jgi:O-antigen/teichoic acid export membrane protein